MATINFLLGIFCLVVTGSFALPVRDMLTPSTRQINNLNTGHRTGLIKIAENELGTRERTGRNDGPKVEAYLTCVQLKKGQPYCAAFISWVYEREGLSRPRSGWSPALFPAARLTTKATPGNVLGIYFATLKRIAHVGLITRQDGHWITSIEANTNVSGSREGDGVYKKRRHLKTIYRIADWVRERGKP